MIFFLNSGHIFYVNTNTYIKTNTQLNDIGLTGAFISITYFNLSSVVFYIGIHQNYVQD